MRVGAKVAMQFVLNFKLHSVVTLNLTGPASGCAFTAQLTFHRPSRCLDVRSMYVHYIQALAIKVPPEGWSHPRDGENLNFSHSNGGI